MPKTFDPRLEMRGRLTGRPPKYPWDQWLNGQTKLLQAGTHFPKGTSPETVRSSVLAVARRRGILVNTERHADGLAIIFPDSPRSTAPVVVEPWLNEAEWEAITDNYRTLITQQRLGGIMTEKWVEYLQHGLFLMGASVYRQADVTALPNLEIMVTMKSLPAPDLPEFVIDAALPKPATKPLDRPYLPEETLNDAFDKGSVAIRPQTRAPFTDEQWIAYLTDEFGAFRAGNPTFEVDPNTGVMKIDINPEPDDDDEADDFFTYPEPDDGVKF